MNVIKKPLLITLANLSLFSSLASPSFSEPHPPPFCPSEGEHSSSGEFKQVTLNQLGLTLVVPAEFTIWRENNGTINLIHHERKKLLECIRNGGRVRYGSGSYGVRIEYTQHNQVSSYINSKHQNSATRPSNWKYRFSDKQGFIIADGSDMTATYFLPVQEGAILITDFCDCEGALEGLTRLLEKSEQFN